MKRPRKPKVGSPMKLWFGETTVLSVKRYEGRYADIFTWVVRVKSDTPRGWIETVI